MSEIDPQDVLTGGMRHKRHLREFIVLVVLAAVIVFALFSLTPNHL